MTEVDYGISITDEKGNHLHDENSRALFETMSGIKSVIGTLAIEKAAQNGHSLFGFTIPVHQGHSSNGSGNLKRLISHKPDGFPLNLQSLLMWNVGYSDTSATNVLIDYLDGKDAINRTIRERLGLSGMRLVTDIINFTGVDHDEQPFQVGMATMRDFTDYYRNLWSEDGYGFDSEEHRWHRDAHGLSRIVGLLGSPRTALPQDVSWLGKTGSGEDVKPDQLYSTRMDAGELRDNGKVLYVAAASTVRHRGPNMPSRRAIVQGFVDNNDKALANLL